MKKILLLLLMATSSIYAQIDINQPQALLSCDNDNDGIEMFDLTTTVPEILGGLSSAYYSVDFYLTMTGAELEDSENLIQDPTNFVRPTGPQTIYVRVEEIVDPTEFALTAFQVTTSELPVFSINDTSICEGSSVVLNSVLNSISYNYAWYYNDVIVPGANESQFIVTQGGTYKLVITDATTGCSYQDSALVTVNPSPVATLSGPEFVDVGQTASFSVTGTPDATVIFTIEHEGTIIDGTGVLDSNGNFEYAIVNLSSTATICLIEATANPLFCTTALTDCITINVGIVDFINIPDANFKAKLLEANTTNQIAQDLNGNWTVVDTNNDGEVQFSEALNISLLDVQMVNINSMEGIENFTNLLDVDCSINGLNFLNVSSLINLQNLKCRNNPITNLQLTNNVNLVSLEVSSSTISTIDIGDNSTITKLHIDNTLIESFDLGNLTNLSNLSYSPGYTDLINFEDKTNITVLSINGNSFTTFDFSLFPNLVGVACNFSTITSIDLSQNSFLTSVHASYNTSLEILNLKNGGPNLSSWQIVSNSLNYVCVNDYVGSGFVTYLTQWNSGLVNINSYCSFVPGGDYNTISGSINYDLDLNGCDALDFPAKYTKFNIGLNGVPTDFIQISDNQGIYNFYTSETGVFTLTPQLENPEIFTVAPINTTVDFPLIDNSVSINNFCITANGIHPDLEVVIAPLVPARPGFDAVYELVYKNKGNQTVEGYVNFTYNETVLDFVASSVLPLNQADGYMNWVVPNIAPFQSGSIVVTLNVNSPQETPAVNIGDVLTFNAFIDVSTDDNWADNNFDFSQIVVGSYDPNDIICLQGDNAPPSEIGNYLHYIVNFENTGTAPAENVVVKVDIDATKYDVSSLQILDGSHPLEAKVGTNNVAEFIFKNINLDTNGHGNILLKMRTKESLNEGDMVTKKANIYFDYNFPILTNDANTTFQDLSVGEHLKDDSIKTYPNPTQNLVNIEADSTIHSVELYDIQGRLLMTHLSSEAKTMLDISDKANGVYFFKIKSEKGIKVEKIIKK